MSKLILFFLITICSGVLAQGQSKNKYKLGCKLGVVDVNMTGGRVKSPSKIALIGGAWFQIKISKNWTAQAEAIYVEKGTRGIGKNRSSVNGYRVAIMYLEVPVLFQYHKKNVTFEFGPGLGALTYQYEFLPGAPTPNMTRAYPFTAKEFSFNLGFGYTFNEKWYSGLRFTHSLLPVREQMPDISKQVYNRVLALTVSRRLSFKKSKNKETQQEE